MVAVLICVGVAFEVAKELLEEHVPKASRPVIHAFFGELMVGGFISIVSFLLVNYGAFTGISEHLFEEETYLNELMEKLHVTLFLVRFCGFLVHVFRQCACVCLPRDALAVRCIGVCCVYCPDFGVARGVVFF